MSPSGEVPKPPLLRSKAWVCGAVNQLAFPGLGTVMSGRRIGYVQATLMVFGFILAMAFLFFLFTTLWRYQMMDFPDKAWFKSEYYRHAWLGTWGFGLMFVAWCWSLVSSIQILRDSGSK